MKGAETITTALTKIRELYRMAKSAELSEMVSGGYLSHNFILHSGDTKFFLKQYRFDSIEKIKEIHRAKFFFEDGGIPIILPIQSDKGDFVFEDAGKFYSLFPFVEGRIIRRTERSPKAFASAGKMLARIHILSKDDYPRIINSYNREWRKREFLEKAKIMKARVETIPKKTDFDKLAIETINRKIRLAEENEICYEDLKLKKDHIIHGDYYGQNIFYDHNDKVQNVFDIEQAEMSPRSLEIARAIDYMCFSNNYDVKNFEDAKTFLSAYNDIYPLSAEELARGIKAYYLEKAHSIWIEEAHYIHKNLRVDCFLEGEPLMLRYYPENFDKFVDRLRV